MPWKYVMPNDVESLREREATVQRISEFWEQFAHRLPEIEAQLAGQAQWDLRAFLSSGGKQKLGLPEGALRPNLEPFLPLLQGK